MNDNHKFRGRMLSGQWVYGFLAGYEKDSDLALINEVKDSQIISQTGVSRETVGRCTGMKDKNKDLIYEDDLVKVVTDSKSEKLGISRYEWITVCEWDTEHGHWHFRQEDMCDGWHMGETDFNCSPFTFEIIGNIHEKRKRGE